MEPHFYNVKVNWTNDRKGILSSSELPNSIEVATPPQFASGIPNVWSPEHLLTAAVNSCLMTTFLAIAENFKLSFNAFESEAKAKLEMVDGKYLITEVWLYPIVTITDEANKAKAERVLQKSEAACLISNSIKSKIVFNPTVKVIT